MKLRWSNQHIKGLSDPVKAAEEVNEWVWWALFVTVVIMGALFILEIMGKI